MENIAPAMTAKAPNIEKLSLKAEHAVVHEEEPDYDRGRTLLVSTGVLRLNLILNMLRKPT